MARHLLTSWSTLLLIGCIDVGDFEFVDEIPVVGENNCAPPREARVACVLDGDTFDLEGCGDGNERVRLLGIDAPEISHNGEEADCWGDEASAELRRLIDGRTVTLTFDEECEGVFGRTLAYAYLSPDEVDVEPDEVGDEDGAILVNELLLSRGAARLFGEERFGEVLLQDRLDAAQAQAQARGLGLWGACPETR